MSLFRFQIREYSQWLVWMVCCCLLASCTNKENALFVLEGSGKLVITPATTSISVGTETVMTAIYIDEKGESTNVSGSAQWRTQHAQIATVDNQGVVTGVAPGHTLVTSTYNGHIAQASLAVFTQPILSVHVKPRESLLFVGSRQYLSAWAVFEDGSQQDITSVAQWSASNTAVITVGQSGLVEGLIRGRSRVTASFRSATGSAGIVVVDNPVVGMIIQPVAPSYPVGIQAPLQSILLLESGETIDVTQSAEWTSSDSAIVAVASIAPNKGQLTNLAEGGVTISAAITLANQVHTASTSVTAEGVRLSGLEVQPLSQMGKVGQSLPFVAVAKYSDDSLWDVSSQAVWTSSQDTIAAVTGQGELGGWVSLRSAGVAEITAELNGLSAQGVVIAEDIALLSIQLSPPKVMLKRGNNMALQAAAYYSDGSIEDVTQQASWVSVDSVVASVDTEVGSKGIVTGENVGQTQIAAYFGGKIDTTDIHVTSPTLVDLQVSPARLTLPKGESTQYEAWAIYSDSSVEKITSSASWQSLNTDIAEVQNIPGQPGLVKGLSVGDVQIQAFYGGIKRAVSLTVSEAQIIDVMIQPRNSVTPIGMVTAYQAVAVFSDESQLDITNVALWRSANSAIASVSALGANRGRVTGMSLGQVNISVQYGGVSDSVVHSVVNPTANFLQITPAIATIYNDDQQQYSAQLVFSDNSTYDVTHTVDWRSQTPTIAEIDQQGLASGLAPGQTHISASLSLPSGEFQATARLNVRAAELEELLVLPVEQSVIAGTTVSFRSFATFSNGMVVEVTDQSHWSSLQLDIATVDPRSGVALGVQAGSADIVCQYDNNGVSISAQGRLTVMPESVVVDELRVTPFRSQTILGGQQRLNATAYLSNGMKQDVTNRVIWLSHDTQIAVVDRTGLATGIAPGIAGISARLIYSQGQIHSDQAQLSVIDPATVIKEFLIQPDSAVVEEGGSQALRLFFLMENLDVIDVTDSGVWVSENPAIAVVDANGLVTGVTAGTVDIIGRAGANGILYEARATVQVTEKSIQRLIVAPHTQLAFQNQQRQYYASVIYSDGSTDDVTASADWRVSDPSIASVGAPGQIYANANNHGVTEVIASFSNSVSASEGAGLLTVFEPLFNSMTLVIEPASTKVPVEKYIAFNAIVQLPSGIRIDVTDVVSWSVDDSAIANIDSAGVALGIAAGQTAVHASLNYKGNQIANATALLQVESSDAFQKLIVIPSHRNLIVGATGDYQAIAIRNDLSSVDVTLLAYWETADEAIAEVSTLGQVSAVSEGETTLTASLNQAGTIISDNALIIVEPSSTTIERIRVTPSFRQSHVGDLIQYNATAILSNKSEVDVTRDANWQVSDPNVAAIQNNEGLIFTKLAGLVTVSASINEGGVDKSGLAELSVIGNTGGIVDSLPNLFIVPGHAFLAVGASEQLTAISKLPDGSELDVTDLGVWSVDADNKASVSSTGLLTGIQPGNVEINFTSGSKSALATAKVLSDNNGVKSINAVPDSAVMIPEGEQEFQYWIEFINGEIDTDYNRTTWTSLQPDIVEVTRPGEVRALQVGSAQVVLEASHGNIVVQDEINISVIDTAGGVDGLTLSPVSDILYVNVSRAYQANLQLTGGPSVDVTYSTSWRSSDASVVALQNDSGLVVGRSKGSAQIEGAINIDGVVYSATTPVTVTDSAVDFLAVTPDTGSASAGDIVAYTATLYLQDTTQIDVTQSVIWQSNDNTVAVAGSNGIVSYQNSGDVVISARWSDIVADAISVTVTP